MKLLMIINIPPPYWGTTIMNKVLLDTLEEKKIGYIHLRVEASKNLQQLGKFKFAKLTPALQVLKGIYASRNDFQTAYLVMSVQGFAFWRHTIYILLLLFLKKNCVLHLRALGFDNKKGLGRLLTRFIFRRSYLVQHSTYNSFDIKDYSSKSVFYVPNGWHDYYDEFKEKVQSRLKDVTGGINVIFLSNLIGDKGLFTVTESILNISLDPHYSNLNIKWNFVGNWENETVKTRFYDYIRTNKLETYLGHVGPLYNNEKYSFLADMHILTFPTFYKLETWGNVILEAMMFKIPVIATRYVAIPEMVKDNVTGFLIDRQDPGALSARLKRLIDDPALRERMGNAGRKLFLQHFTLETFKTNIINVLSNCNHEA